MKKRVRFTVTAGIIAALYALLTYLSAALGLAYGPIQFRLSEGLCVLAAATPAAIPGLVVGCLVANLGSPFGVVDIIFGTLATLIAAVLGYLFRRQRVFGLPWVAMVAPVVVNALLVGAENALLFAQGQAAWPIFWMTALEVALGELAVCVLLGAALWKTSEKINLLK